MNLKIEEKKSKNPKGAVIYLHGLGNRGADFFHITSQLQLENNLDFYFPQAPIRPVTRHMGETISAWFDVHPKEESNRGADLRGLEKITKTIHQLMGCIVDGGISSQNITLIGFSQGGTLALHAGISYPKKIKTIIGLATYLGNLDIQSYQSQENKSTPILLLHGNEDSVVDYSVAEFAKKHLEEYNYNVTLKSEPIKHTVNSYQIKIIDSWLSNLYQ